MTRDESIELSARIQDTIASFGPVADLASPLQFFDLFRNSSYASTQDGFFQTLEENFRIFPAAAFERDPYLLAMKDLPERTVEGKFTLAVTSYEAGEIFAYDAPLTSGLSREEAGTSLMVPRLGCFDRKVSFPAVYEDAIPWMSICPSEMNTMRAPIDHAVRFVRQRAAQSGTGSRLLVLGLGLGYFPFLLAEEESVREIVIAEWSKEIIDLFERHLLPRFPHREKLRIVQGDAFDVLRSTGPEEIDYVFADTWESQYDGAKDYMRIMRHMKRLSPDTDPHDLTAPVGFSCWIEPQITAFLKDEGIL